MSQNSSNHEIILRKIGEDPILRPFLSSLFDNETYINHIIQEKKSEECLTLISSSTELINEEIQRYITENRDILMSGMQDVASLASQYQTLVDHSKGVQSSIQKLKKEVNESYDVVRNKTQELERIHETNFLLNQLRQFIKAKSQLTQYLKNQDDKDTRSLASAARTIAELESLLTNPKLLEIQIVHKSVNEIKTFSNNIRILSQTNLFQAIEEKNQLEISNFLQVFYNLESLYEINLLVIDNFVKKTVDKTRQLLDFQNLQLLYQDYLNKSGGSSVTPSTSSASLSMSASKRSLVSLTSSSSAAASGNTVTVAQLRIAMKELGHIWSSMIYDVATQIMAFQRVLWKKEDPVTHEKFLNVLKQARSPTSSTTSPSSGNDPVITHQYLSAGQLLTLYWHRLSFALQDVSFEKVKEYPAITNRAYLCLRKSLSEILQSIEYWNEEESQRNLGPAMKFMKALSSANDPSWKKNILSDDGSEERYSGMFGSLTWTNDDILNSSYVTKLLSKNKASLLMNRSVNRERSSTSVDDKKEGNKKSSDEGIHSKDSIKLNTDHPLVTGLKPFHDRYLLSVLERMNVPITQMFPELEGYTSAVPSKRDLQTFIKAITNEFITIIVESDDRIIYSICHEFLKVNKLMLSKIQDLVIHNQESRKVGTINSTGGMSNISTSGATVPSFQRNNAQEQNLQLFVLLLQLKESLEKIPTQIMKYLDENALLTVPQMKGSSEEKNKSSSKEHFLTHSTIMKEIQKTMTIAVFQIYELTVREILSPIIETISDYVLTTLLPLQKESILYLNKSTPSSAVAVNLDCSLAVQNLLRQLPSLLKTYLFILPKNYTTILIEYAMEEIAMRVIQSYLSIACLSRPFSEITKMKIAKDLSSLEECLSTFCAFNSPSIQKSAILEEYRSFRRYLFEESNGAVKFNTDAVGGIKTNIISEPPKIPSLLSLDYIYHLRPSVLLGYLIANGPSQLPLPFEMTEKDLAYYLHSVVLNYQQAASTSSTTEDKFETSIQQYYDSQEYSNLLLEYAQSSSGGKNNNTKKTEDAFIANLSSRLFHKNILSVHNFYHKDSPSSTSTSATSLLATSAIKRYYLWKNNENEKQNWELIQKGLDIFFQRMTVTENIEQKQLMRVWYESIMDIGSQFFS